MNAALLRVRAWRVPSLAPAWGAWVAAEQGRFAPWLAVCAVAGALLYFVLPAEPPGYAGPALAAAGAVLVWRLRAWLAGLGAALALVFLALGFTAGQWAAWRAPPPLSLPRTAAVFTATVASVDPLPEGRRLTLVDAQLETGERLGRSLHLRLRPADLQPLAAGDVVRARAVLRPPAPPAYPGGWDLQRDAFFSGLGGAGAALGPVTRLASAPAASPGRLLLGVREAVAARLMAGLPGPQGTVAATVLTGIGTAIPPELRAAYRDSGLAHLLAVAGLHIGIVMAVAMAAARFGLACWERAALNWPCKQLASGAAVLCGGAYVLLSGAHVPVLRAYAMASLVALGVATGRRALSMRGLAAAACVVVLSQPEAVVGVSFQMSFAAVLTLIAGYEWLRPSLARLRGRRVSRHVAALLLTSLLAGLASVPFGAFHFGRVQLYFLLANAVAVPVFASVVMPVGLLALVLMPLGLERLALLPMGWALDVIAWIARSTAALPAATLGVPHIPAWGLALAGLGMAWLGLWRSRLRLAGAAAILAGLGAGLVSPPADLLVSSDARLIALRDPAGLQTRPGFSRFVLDSWQQYWAEALAAPFPETGAPGPVQCDPAGCRIAQGGVRVLLARGQGAMACDGVALVVSAAAAGACPGLPRIDRAAVLRDGAYAVWLRGGAARLVSDREWRGVRPWVAEPEGDSHTRVTQPLALSE